MTSVESLLSWGIPLLITLSVAGIIGWLIHRAIPWKPRSSIVRQSVLAVLGLFTLIILPLVLPFDNETRGQLLSLFGLVITAMIALASTSSVSNGVAGIMLRMIGSYHLGDFIRVGEHFGRVTEQGLLHTEVQSEDRDLITLPNLYLITNPVRVVRMSGTLISADVSLGYDTHRKRITELLKQAATRADLEDAFVQILELGDFSVSYRISGFLRDVSNLVSKKTELRARVMDALHEDGVEIASPAIMNQRPVATAHRFVPPHRQGPDMDSDTGVAEKLMFDKAEIAATLARLKLQRDELLQEIKTLEAEDLEEVGLEIAWRRHQVESVTGIIESLEQSAS